MLNTIILVLSLVAIITAASLAPALLAGTVLGMVVFHRVNARFFRGFSVAIVICAGLLGIISGVGLFPSFGPVNTNEY